MPTPPKTIWQCPGCRRRLMISGNVDTSKIFCSYCRTVTGEKSDAKHRPSLVQRVANFAKAFAPHAIKGFPKAAQATIEERLAVCQSCEYFNGKLCTHRKCGCNIGKESVFLNKLAWADQRCPLSKWGPVANKS